MRRLVWYVARDNEKHDKKRKEGALVSRKKGEKIVQMPTNQPLDGKKGATSRNAFHPILK